MFDEKFFIREKRFDFLKPFKPVLVKFANIDSVHKKNHICAAISLESNFVVGKLRAQARRVNQVNVVVPLLRLNFNRRANVLFGKNIFVEQRIEQRTFAVIHDACIDNVNALRVGDDCVDFFLKFLDVIFHKTASFRRYYIKNFLRVMYLVALLLGQIGK